MSRLIERLRGWAAINDMGRKPDKEDLRRQAADRIEHLERVLAQARESMTALDVLFRPLARDCTAATWIDNNSKAIAAIDEALK